MHRRHKSLAFFSTSKDDLTQFPDLAKQQLGHVLWLLQSGLEPDPGSVAAMPEIGAGVLEVKCRYVGPQGQDFRVFYVAKFNEAIYVLHAFEKRTQQTSPRDMKLGRRRWKQLTGWRAEQGLDVRAPRRTR